MVRGRGGACCKFGAGVGATSSTGKAIISEFAIAEERTGPQRRCLATGTVCDRSQLLRFVVGPGGDLIPDLAARLPGRGLWLMPRRDVVERALAKRVFARIARQPVTIPERLGDHLETLLARRCIDGIGLARRAGIAVCGFTRVFEAVREGKAVLLLAALDGAEGGWHKLEGLAQHLPLVRVLTAAELGAAFGREHVVNAAMGSGPLSRRLLIDARRLAGFRADAMFGRANKTIPASRNGTMAVLERNDGRN